jgi:hypothetical protein
MPLCLKTVSTTQWMNRAGARLLLLLSRQHTPSFLHLSSMFIFFARKSQGSNPPPSHSSHSFTLRLLDFWKDEAHLFLELSTWTSVLCIAHFQQIILSTLMNSGIWPVPQQTQSSLSVCAVLVSCAIKTRQKVTANNEDIRNTYCLIFSCLNHDTQRSLHAGFQNFGLARG